jgi:hypothetical protein
MPSLYARVEYAVKLTGAEPPGLDLVGYTQDNPMLDAHRQVLAAEFPRRKFETNLLLTVGGLRADGGTYYERKERDAGFTELAELQATGKLGVVNSRHWISKVSDFHDPGRDEGSAVSVEVRPREGCATVSMSASGPFGDRHLATLVEAAWRSFQHLVDAAPVATANARWDSQWEQFLRPPGERGVGAFILVDQLTAQALGRGAAAAKRLGAFDWKAVRSDERNGLITQLGRRPEDTTGDRLAEIQADLRAASPHLRPE